MKEIVLITGSSGNLAKSVILLLGKFYEVRSLTTNRRLVNQQNIFYWDINNKYLDERALYNCNHIIHLAGYSIMKRWSKKNKKLMYNSRVEGANLLFQQSKKLNIAVFTFISASAIGYYGFSAIGSKKESDQIGNDWVSDMVNKWENSADQFKQLGARVIQMRISLLLSNYSGFLKAYLLSMRYGLVFMFGNKKKKINWIYINDVVRFIHQSLNNKKYKGRYNLSAREYITQEDLIQQLKTNLFPCVLTIKIPDFFVKLLLGDRVKVINTDFIVDTEKLNKHAFFCKYNNFKELLVMLKENSN